MRSLKPILFILLATATLAWSQTEAATDALDHTKWRLSGIEGAGDAKPGQHPATVLFDRGRFSIAACNSISGPYKVEDGKIVGGNGISTRKACMPEAQALDDALTKVFAGSPSFQIAGRNLTVTGADGAKFSFVRVPLPSKEAVTKFVCVSSEKVDCTGVGPMKCLQIKEEKDQPWQNYYGKIIGFNPVPGIEYRLRIKEDTIKNPPADSSNKIWYLDMVVEQKVVDRAAADAYHEAQQKKK